ncbi:MAG: hypothetical protein KGL39_25995 [Patescibacteria group bacterium]|nr:hypothetical protein [Patescibacteria group bacterium]
MALPPKESPAAHAPEADPGLVARGNGSGPAPAPAAPGSGRFARAVQSVAGALRRRKDGLDPKSGAAEAADREKERLRKQQQRAAKRAAEPPPALPPALAPAPQASAGPVPPPAGPVGAGAVLSPGVAPAPEPPILWAGGDLAPVTDALVPLLEEIQHDKKLAKLRKAKIDATIVREIERDFAWPDKSKAMLSKTGASLGAKWLNKAGLSAAYKDEVNFGVALMVILRCEAAVNRRLDKLIAAAEAAEKSKSTPPPKPVETPAPPKWGNVTDAFQAPVPPATQEKK